MLLRVDDEVGPCRLEFRAAAESPGDARYGETRVVTGFHVYVGVAYVERPLRRGIELLENMERDGRCRFGIELRRMALDDGESAGAEIAFDQREAAAWSLLVRTASVSPAERSASSISMVPG